MGIKTVWCVLAAAILLTGQCVRADDTLLGTWNVTLVSDDTGKTTADVLTFDRFDQLTSAWAAKQGFKDPIPCVIDGRLQSRTFTAGAKSGTSEVKWTGTAAVAEISGTVSWTKADGANVTYSFKGTKAGK